MRAKWDERHAADGRTYGELTIERAVAGCSAVYDTREPRITVEDVSFPLLDVASADAWTFDPVEFTVDQIIPRRGTVWLGGLPKGGKSLFAFYCCLAIAAARDTVAGHFTVRHRPRVLYVSREDSGPRLQERRAEILSSWELRPSEGSMLVAARPRLDLLNPHHVGWLRQTCVQHGIGLLVLDTWTALSPGADPLGAKDQAQLAATVVQLTEDIDGAVVVLDHSRKNPPEGAALSSAEIFGPLQKWAAAEHIVMLRKVGRNEELRRLEVFIEGKDADSARLFLDVSPRASGKEKFSYGGSAAAVIEQRREIGDQNRDAVFQAVVRAGGWVTVEDVGAALRAAGTEISDRAISRHLGALAEARRLEREGKPGTAARYLARNLASDQVALIDAGEVTRWRG
jgi:DNA-binding transcriptional ArsR family regulator